jgi:hypothetical protein
VRGSGTVFRFQILLLRREHSDLNEVIVECAAAGLQLQLLLDFSGRCGAVAPFRPQSRRRRPNAAHSRSLLASEKLVRRGQDDDLSVFFTLAPTRPRRDGVGRLPIGAFQVRHLAAVEGKFEAFKRNSKLQLNFLAVEHGGEGLEGGRGLLGSGCEADRGDDAKAQGLRLRRKRHE